MIIVEATLIAKPGKREEVIALSKDCVTATRQEKGCISYTLLSSAEDEVTLLFFEQWEDLDCLKSHTKTAHYKAFGEARKPLVEGPSRVRLFEATEINFK